MGHSTSKITTGYTVENFFREFKKNISEQKNYINYVQQLLNTELNERRFISLWKNEDLRVYDPYKSFNQQSQPLFVLRLIRVNYFENVSIMFVKKDNKMANYLIKLFIKQGYIGCRIKCHASDHKIRDYKSYRECSKHCLEKGMIAYTGFFNYYHLKYKKIKQKLILLAWAQDRNCLLSQLPKDIIKIIIELADL